ncbi:MAG TPA: DUF4232 domain-containing protein, partial [Acidimicrobiales bacterium]|nr:DUF4232 domain-containing protein [Acidimicrobiales bacterium]
ETHSGAYQGAAVQFVTLRNAGPSPCSLQGTPTVTGISATAGSVTVNNAATSENSTLVLLDPGDEAYLMVSAQGRCAASGTSEVLSTLILGLPQGGTITVPNTWLDIACATTTVAPFFPNPSNSALATPPGPLSGLQATLSISSTVSPGSTVS